MNGEVVTNGTAANLSSLLGALDASFMDDTDRVETLFLATLSRRPSADEHSRFLDYLQSEKNAGSTQNRGSALADVLWAMLNSSEFAFNH